MDLVKDISVYDSPDYYFFWAGECSQWFLSPFEEFGESFNTAEQFMMAAKAKLFDDEESFEKIMTTTDPRAQKKYGRGVKNFDQERWQDVARGYVILGNYNKFTQNPELYEFLMEHRGKFFVEASPYDKVWGIGMGAGTLGVENPANWKGTNWLGECINNARDIIVDDLVEIATPPPNMPDVLNILRTSLDWRK